MMEAASLESALCAIVLGLIIAYYLLIRPKGILFWKNYYSNLLFILRYKSSKKRIPTYDNIANKDATLVDLGVIPTDEEYELENPQRHLEGGFCDGIHIFGVDTNQNFVDIIINNIGSNQATVWIILKISGRGTYVLPSHPDTRHAYVENEQGFRACGLNICCCCPLRRWRLSFNGELKKYDHNNEGVSSEDLVHVKFSFVWLALSLVHDLKLEYDVSELAKAFISSGQNHEGERNLSNFEARQNRYEQWGQLMGTVQIGLEEEQEFYLWSARTRILDKPVWEENIESAKLYFYFKNGVQIKIEVTSVESLMSNYVNGYTISAGGRKRDIINCSMNFPAFMKAAFSSNSMISFECCGNQKLVVSCSEQGLTMFIGPFLERTVIMTPVTVQMFNEQGFGVIYSCFRSMKTSKKLNVPLLLLKDKGYTASEQNLLLPLEDKLCQSSVLAGGKGCSLALLTHLAEHTKCFSVPKGFVITTTAFEMHMKMNANLLKAVERLVDVSCGKIEADLKYECERCCSEFSSTELLPSLKSVIKAQITSQFESADTLKFAVRSSAYGEDSDEFSCAGLMSTYLGVSGFDMLLEAIANCWASHFRFEVVQYCRQNGQSIDSLMAVVVQEMVPADVAGVMFTVDPVSGNPAFPCITANYGLGETVVSAAVEPDTFILKKHSDGLLTLHEQKLGSKMIQATMKEEGGTEEKAVPVALSSFCLTKDWALKIGDIGLFVSECFCGPRDLEWALMGKQIFLLQARPVTSLHHVTEFELFHEHDTPVGTSYQYYTRANTGEVFLGSCSPLGLSLVVASMDLNTSRNFIITRRPGNFAYVPYCLHFLPVTHRQVTLNLTDALFQFNGQKISTTQKAFLIAFFGRVIEADDIHRCGVKKFGYMTTVRKLVTACRHLRVIFGSRLNIDSVSDRVNSLHIPVESFVNSRSMYRSICHQMNLYFKVSALHGASTFTSSIFNVMILMTLVRNEQAWNNTLYSDFATLLSSCCEVESADVPSSLEELSKAISEADAVTFASVPVEVAYSLLKNDTGLAGKLFKEFLKKHGHRCVKEFDVRSLSWGMKPENLVEILQSMVKSPNTKYLMTKKVTTVSSAIKQLKTPLSFMSKIILRVVLPWCRTAVGERERTKSLLIKVIDSLRRSCYRLGELLVQEGLIPDKDLVFFLTLDEIKSLLEVKGSPCLVPKAVRRRHIHPVLDSLQFPEIMAGVPKPIKEQQQLNESPAFELRGTPICSGIVKAKARVVLCLEEASLIKNGEILVTHATDIGWSPYFPLLSGVVTVLGGLISHGAVVAREYGLPCIVGVQNATSVIKSGDLIILDAIKGTVTKIEQSETSV